MKKLLVPLLALAATAAFAKLPAPDDAAKAKAAEAAAKTAWQGKIDNYLLCKSQDKVVASYKKGGGKAASPAAPMPAAAMPATAASGGTPVAGVAAPAPIPPCADPGPFAYVPPAQKPLEAAGAHSPPGTAMSPPSTKTPSAEIAPAKPSTGPAKKS